MGFLFFFLNTDTDFTATDIVDFCAGLKMDSCYVHCVPTLCC